MKQQSLIRNFSIIAHIDHGKSSLADQLLLLTGTITEREFKSQILDSMDLERERGITIKASSVTAHYNYKGQNYTINLIDTPGHVDFNYEVSRSLAAVEGALLVVDASQGVEAQTIANVYLAMDQNLEIIPCLNKIDLPHAHADEVCREIEQFIGIPCENALRVSAKSGVGCENILPRIIELVPPPSGDPKATLQALIFDSAYNDYRGVIVHVRVMQGTIRKGDHIQFMASGGEYEVGDLGIFVPSMQSCETLEAGEVGYLVAGIKTIRDVTVGDTVTYAKERASLTALPGFKKPKPMVFCGLYPTNHADFNELKDALDKLMLNDSSLRYETENSDALGFGFRCGFLGPLHMEIVQERLEREFDLDLVQCAPNVTYEIKTMAGETIEVYNPSAIPDPSQIEEFREPFVKLSIIVPQDAIGGLMKLCLDRRGIFKNQEYLSATRVVLIFEIPLAEIIFDFYDALKSGTRGYGTMDYELIGFKAGDLVKLDILVSGNKVDALSAICHREQASGKGRAIVRSLQKDIPRHAFEIPLQAAVGAKIMARETIRAYRKDVLAKCYGGDISRKRKLLEKQKEGKKRMKTVGNVEIPQKAFLSVLTAESDTR